MPKSKHSPEFRAKVSQHNLDNDFTEKRIKGLRHRKGAVFAAAGDSLSDGRLQCVSMKRHTQDTQLHMYKK